MSDIQSPHERESSDRSAPAKVSEISALGIADTSSQDIVLEQSKLGPLKKSWWIWLGLLAVLILILSLFVPNVLRWASAQTSISADRLRLATVTRGDLIRDVSVQGRVIAAVSPTLYAADNGTITFQVNPGDSVNQGDLLAIVESPELANQLAQAQGLLAQKRVELERQAIQSKQKNLSNQKTVDLAKLNLSATKRESRRAIEAFEKDAISQVDYQKAQDELESAEYAFNHAAADAELDGERLDFEQRTKQLEVEQQELLEKDLRRQVDALRLVSPVNGVVGNLLVPQKTNVTRNQAVLSVVDLTQFEVESEIPESYADDLAIGMQTEVISGNSTYPARLVSISPEIIDNQVTTRMRFDANNIPAGLRQNQRLTTRVLLEQRNDVLVLNRGQFLESGSGRIAYVVKDNLAQKTAISVGARSLNQVEITSGLDAGDVVVISSTDTFEAAETVLITQ